METYLKLTDWLLPDHSLTQTEAVKHAVRFCSEFGFTGPEYALSFLKEAELMPVLSSSKDKLIDFNLN